MRREAHHNPSKPWAERRSYSRPSHSRPRPTEQQLALPIEGLDFLKRAVLVLGLALPGIELGYDGATGRNEYGQFDSRQWFVLLPHPGRPETFRDRIHLGGSADLVDLPQRWRALEIQIRFQYHSAWRAG